MIYRPKMGNIRKIVLKDRKNLSIDHSGHNITGVYLGFKIPMPSSGGVVCVCRWVWMCLTVWVSVCVWLYVFVCVCGCLSVCVWMVVFQYICVCRGLNPRILLFWGCLTGLSGYFRGSSGNYEVTFVHIFAQDLLRLFSSSITRLVLHPSQSMRGKL